MSGLAVMGRLRIRVLLWVWGAAGYGLPCRDSLRVRNRGIRRALGYWRAGWLRGRLEFGRSSKKGACWLPYRLDDIVAPGGYLVFSVDSSGWFMS